MMQLRPEIRLQTAIEAMTRVIIPAIDPDEELAQEQAQLVVGMLNMVAEWLPLEYAYDHDELAHLLLVAGELESKLSGGSRTKESHKELVATATHGQDVLNRAGADPRELHDTVRTLRADLGEVVQAVFEDGGSPSRQAVRESVLVSSKRQILRERVAMASQGFEGDDPDLPSLEELLSQSTRG